MKKLDNIINNLVGSNNKFINIDKDNINYQYFIKAKEELEQLEIVSYTTEEVQKIINNSPLTKTYLKLMNEIRVDKLYKSYIHGINHNIRVSYLALIISTIENIKEEDFKLIIETCKYHDIGRINDYEDREHGLNGANKLDFLSSKYNEDELNYLKTVITCHSLKDTYFKQLAIKNKIKDIDKCKKIFEILKDADALDRVRLEYPVVKISYLRIFSSKKLILYAYQLFYNYEMLMEEK